AEWSLVEGFERYEGLGMRLDWKGQPIRVRDFGQGPPVVLVHGYPLDGAMWSRVARTLSQRFRVLKLDLPGHGENTSPAGGSIEDYADYVEAVLGQVEERTGLAGFSMGGYAVLALMRRRPARVGALALVDSRPKPDDQPPQAAPGSAHAARRSRRP